MVLYVPQLFPLLAAIYKNLFYTKIWKIRCILKYVGDFLLLASRKRGSRGGISPKKSILLFELCWAQRVNRLSGLENLLLPNAAMLPVMLPSGLTGSKGTWVLFPAWVVNSHLLLHFKPCWMIYHGKRVMSWSADQAVAVCSHMLASVSWTNVDLAKCSFSS